MIHLDPDELLDALDELARTRGLVARLDREAMVAALAEAGALAAGRSEHEVAALLYAFGRRSLSFGPAVRPFLRALLEARAIATGSQLEMSELEFSMNHAGIVRGEIEFLELRGWVAARLRPLGQPAKRRPPRRPR